MKNLRCVIVEDIAANREALKKLLAEECPFVEVLGEADNIKEAETLIQSIQPRLVFMDIEIKSATSFDLLDRLHQNDAINFEIIFFTAHGTYEYATRAIEFSALDFLTKPLNSEKLKLAVEKASNKLNQTQYNAQIELLLETLSLPNQQSKRIAFHLIKGIVEFVQVDDIIYLEADGTLTYVYLQNGNRLTAVKNLGHYSKLLLSGYSFFPISNAN